MESGEKKADLVQPLSKESKTLLEILASQQHQIWAHWMQYLFQVSTKNPDGSLTVPEYLVERWTHQVQTQYSNLSEKEKESDREQAQKILDALQ